MCHSCSCSRRAFCEEAGSTSGWAWGRGARCGPLLSAAALKRSVARRARSTRARGGRGRMCPGVSTQRLYYSCLQVSNGISLGRARAITIVQLEPNDKKWCVWNSGHGHADASAHIVTIWDTRMYSCRVSRGRDILILPAALQAPRLSCRPLSARWSPSGTTLASASLWATAAGRTRAR